MAGEVIHRLSRVKLYALRKRMGMLFQTGGLFTHLNVFENVAFPLREHTPLSNAMIRDLVLLKLQMVGLRGARDLMPSELSGGMARRVALARAIVLGPKIMMYDEPFSGQDPIGRGVLLRVIKELNDALSLTSVIVSHDVHETAQIADYIVILFRGKILGAGTPDEIIHHPSEEVQQFVKGLADGPVSFHFPAKNFKEELQIN